jgi:aldehyde dehydrogenase (NAD(P)+)
MGLTGDVWMPPGVSAEEVQATIGGIYRAGTPRESHVGAILGAGNLTSIPVMDVVYKVFVEDQVVVLKLNPITDHLSPVFSEALRALIDRGYLRIVHGRAEEAQYLVKGGYLSNSGSLRMCRRPARTTRARTWSC